MHDISARDGTGGWEHPVCNPEIIEDLLTGHNLIRRVFLQSPEQISRNNTIVRPGDPAPPVLMIRSGYAARSCITATGRRAIVDIFVPGDVCAADHAITKYPTDEIRSIGLTRFHAVTAAAFRELFSQPPAALRIMGIVAEARYRVERIAAMKALDARARICVALFDLYERLRRYGAINELRYYLPFTQEQLGEYLGLSNVHVSRTLQRLEQDRILQIDHRLVIIEDLQSLYECASGLPLAVQLPL
jgi:CRP/FNR family transcriptional regulator, anaerobic regulatory protein